MVSREDQVNRLRRTGTDLPFTRTLNGMRVWREVNLMGEIDVNVETKSPVCWPVISTPVAIAWGRDAGKRAPAAVRWPRVGLVEADCWECGICSTDTKHVRIHFKSTLGLLMTTSGDVVSLFSFVEKPPQLAAAM